MKRPIRKCTLKCRQDVDRPSTKPFDLPPRSKDLQSQIRRLSSRMLLCLPEEYVRNLDRVVAKLVKRVNDTKSATRMIELTCVELDTSPHKKYQILYKLMQDLKSRSPPKRLSSVILAETEATISDIMNQIVQTSLQSSLLPNHLLSDGCVEEKLSQNCLFIVDDRAASKAIEDKSLFSNHTTTDDKNVANNRSFSGSLNVQCESQNLNDCTEEITMRNHNNCTEASNEDLPSSEATKRSDFIDNPRCDPLNPSESEVAIHLLNSSVESQHSLLNPSELEAKEQSDLCVEHHNDRLNKSESKAIRRYHLSDKPHPNRLKLLEFKTKEQPDLIDEPHGDQLNYPFPEMSERSNIINDLNPNRLNNLKLYTAKRSMLIDHPHLDRLNNPDSETVKKSTLIDYPHVNRANNLEAETANQSKLIDDPHLDRLNNPESEKVKQSNLIDDPHLDRLNNPESKKAEQSNLIDSPNFDRLNNPESETDKQLDSIDDPHSTQLNHSESVAITQSDLIDDLHIRQLNHPEPIATTQSDSIEDPHLGQKNQSEESNQSKLIDNFHLRRFNNPKFGVSEQPESINHPHQTRLYHSKSEEIKHSDSKDDHHRARLVYKINRLQQILFALRNRISELDSEEISLDLLDSPENAYMQQSQLMHRAVKACRLINKFVHQLRKISSKKDELVGVASSSATDSSIEEDFRTIPLHEQHFHCKLSRYPSIDKYICALVMQTRCHSSKRSNSATYEFLRNIGLIKSATSSKHRGIYFPDYQDVRFLITKLLQSNSEVQKEASELFDSTTTPSDPKCQPQINIRLVDQVAKSIFSKLGSSLQSFRRQELHQSLLSRLPDDFSYKNDPAEEVGLGSVQLKELLTNNKFATANKLNAIFERFSNMDVALCCPPTGDPSSISGNLTIMDETHKQSSNNLKEESDVKVIITSNELIGQSQRNPFVDQIQRRESDSIECIKIESDEDSSTLPPIGDERSQRLSPCERCAVGSLKRPHSFESDEFNECRKTAATHSISSSDDDCIIID